MSRTTRSASKPLSEVTNDATSKVAHISIKPPTKAPPKSRKPAKEQAPEEAPEPAAAPCPAADEVGISYAKIIAQPTESEGVVVRTRTTFDEDGNLSMTKVGWSASCLARSLGLLVCPRMIYIS